MIKRNVKMEVSLDELNDILELGIKFIRFLIIVVLLMLTGLITYGLIL